MGLVESEVEHAAQCILSLVADMPGRFGRLRVVRVVSGRSISYRGEDDSSPDPDFSKYTTDVPADWQLSDLCDLVDALLSGGLIDRTSGMRPVLVLTRAGHRALDALEGTRHINE